MFGVICGRQNQPNGHYKDSTDVSTRLAGKGVKYLFSVIELLNSLRNIEAHLRDCDIGNFVRKKYPFLLSHVWHVRLDNCTHVVLA